MDASEGGVLLAIEKMLGQIYIPALKANKAGWGELSNSSQGEHIKKQFLNNLESFVGVLAGARESLEEKVILEVTTFCYICKDCDTARREFFKTLLFFAKLCFLILQEHRSSV